MGKKALCSFIWILNLVDGMLGVGCWHRSCVPPQLPAEGSWVVSERLGQGCRRAAREIQSMQHFSCGRDPNNTHHPQLQAGTTVQALAKVHKTSVALEQPGRKRGENGLWADSRRKQGGHRLPSGTQHRNGVVVGGRRSGKSGPVAVYSGGHVRPTEAQGGCFYCA